MSTSILTAGIVFLSSLLNINPTQNDIQLLTAKEDIKYKCGKITWIKKTPKWKGRKFYGSIETKCTFEGQTGKGYKSLQAYLVQKLEKEAEKIHKGPVKEKYKKLPSVRYDATLKFGDAKSKDALTVRQDIQIATNGKDLMLSAAESTSVKGKGNGKYLKKINHYFKLVPHVAKAPPKTPAMVDEDEDEAEEEEEEEKKLDEYEITITADFELKKPFLIPKGIFEREVKKAIQQQGADLRKSIILDVANNI